MEWLSLPEEVEQFSLCMSAQLDFRLEADNFDRFNENFCDDPHVDFPKAVRPWITVRNKIISHNQIACVLNLFIF